MKRFVSSIILSAALLTPAILSAEPQRYYDRERRDYHEWNDAETRAHRHWLMEERRQQRYREYRRTNRRDQQLYWKWRHEHQDWR
jgi:Ni/Co efflux regulator RcnB